MKKIIRITTVIAGACAFVGMAQAQNDFHHLSFNIGGGFTTATQGISSRLDYGGNFQASAAFNLNRTLGVEGTFMFNDLGITGSALRAAGEHNGSARTYSITIDPKIRFWSGEKASAYLLGGGGWMRRTVEFTAPTLAQTFIYDPWFGYFGPALVPANRVLGTYSENAGLWDVGAGFNFPLPRTTWKLYVEARYLDGLTAGQHTTLVPITLGLRW